MPLTLEQYARYLDTREDLSWPAAPELLPAKAKPHLVRLPGLRAVTWSLYGTLLVVTGGELVFEHPQRFMMDLALDKTIQEFSMWGAMTRKPGQPAEYLRPIYSQLVAQQSTLSTSRRKHPEIAAERVWEGVVKKLLQKDYRFDTGFYGALNEFSAKIAYFFQSSLQGIRPQAGAAAVLRAVSGQGLAQGLVADGQCFSLVQLQRGLSEQESAARVEDLIGPKLAVLSARLGVRKPSEALFQSVLDVLAEDAILPDQVLHVGTRVSQDVVPARRLGMKTGLFAGDAGALEATPEQLRAPASRPDVLLTTLDQIAEVIPCA